MLSIIRQQLIIFNIPRLLIIITHQGDRVREKKGGERLLSNLNFSYLVF